MVDDDDEFNEEAANVYEMQKIKGSTAPSQRYLIDGSRLGINNNPRSGEDGSSSTDMTSDISLESERKRPFSLTEYLDQSSFPETKGTAILPW